MADSARPSSSASIASAPLPSVASPSSSAPRPSSSAAVTTPKAPAKPSNDLKQQGNPANVTVNDIPELIIEYLQYHGYSKTLESLSEEAISDELAQTVPGSAPLTRQRIGEILGSFDMGDADLFLDCWRRFVPSSLRTSRDVTYEKIEFYVQVYMSLYPLIENLSKSPDKQKNETSVLQDMAPRMRRLKAYFDLFSSFDKNGIDTKPNAEPHLEQNKDSSSISHEFLSYFSLPYIRRPQAHPSFTHLFKTEWANNLRQNLQTFLEKISDAKGPEPLLHAVIQRVSHTSQHSSHQNDEKLHAMMAQMQREEHQWRSASEDRMKRMWGTYRELHSMAQELTIALEGAQSGKRLNAEYVASVHARLDRHNRAVVQDEFGIASGAAFASAHNSGLAQAGRANRLPLLNYMRVRSDLTSLADLDKCLLLQALRWRISKTRSARMRREIIFSYAQNDIFSIESNNSGAADATVLLRLLSSSNAFVREYTLRLINSMSSECAGRTYFLRCEPMIPVLVRCLHDEQTDTSIRQHALGSLQKFSLRRRAQSKMIELDTVRRLCHILKEIDSCSEYTIEYGTALLMNLCLRSAGKIRCEQPDTPLLPVLIDLLEHENFQVRTYVNGVLYSVLTRSALRDQARSLGLHDAITYAMENCDDTLQRQLNFVLEQLTASPEDKADNNLLSDDEDEDDDDYDPEDDDSPTLDGRSSGARGSTASAISADSGGDQIGDSNDVSDDEEDDEGELLRAVAKQSGNNNADAVQQGEHYFVHSGYTDGAAAGAAHPPLSHHGGPSVRSSVASHHGGSLRASVNRMPGPSGAPPQRPVTPSVRDSSEIAFQSKTRVPRTPDNGDADPGIYLPPPPSEKTIQKVKQQLKDQAGDVPPEAVVTKEYNEAFASRARLARTPMGYGGFEMDEEEMDDSPAPAPVPQAHVTPTKGRTAPAASSVSSSMPHHPKNALSSGGSMYSSVSLPKGSGSPGQSDVKQPVIRGGLTSTKSGIPAPSAAAQGAASAARRR